MSAPFDFGQMYDDERSMPLDVSEYIRRGSDRPIADLGGLAELYEEDEDSDAIANPR